MGPDPDPARRCRKGRRRFVNLGRQNLPMGMSRKKLLDDRFIFGGMQGAGGVDQRATGLDPGGGAF